MISHLHFSKVLETSYSVLISEGGVPLCLLIFLILQKQRQQIYAKGVDEENRQSTGLKMSRKMLLQELDFTGRELHFTITIQFITLREERIVEEINGKEKSLQFKIKNLL